VTRRHGQHQPERSATVLRGGEEGIEEYLTTKCVAVQT